MQRKIILAAIGVITLAAPGLAAAQTYYGQSEYRQTYTPPTYGEPRYEQRGWQSGGDYYGRRFTGYPEFRGIEAHIRGEIIQAMRDESIDRGDARDLLGQLRQIQAWEAREFRIHGWSLPQDDREQLRSRLAQLDALVDQTRDES